MTKDTTLSHKYKYWYDLGNSLEKTCTRKFVNDNENGASLRDDCKLMSLTSGGIYFLKLTEKLIIRVLINNIHRNCMLQSNFTVTAVFLAYAIALLLS